jgi:1-acyl-sn-glycerol-3-phosphate acyltransferase
MLPVFWLIGKFNQDAKDRGSLRFVQGVFKVVLFLSGVTTTVKGLENLPKDGEAVLFVGNHHGFFDTIISYTYMKPRTGFVAKKEIEKAFRLLFYTSTYKTSFLCRNIQTFL